MGDDQTRHAVELSAVERDEYGAVPPGLGSDQHIIGTDPCFIGFEPQPGG